MSPDEHRKAWEAYNQHLSENGDMLDDIEGKISEAIYYGSDAVAITMSTREWDAVFRLMQMGRADLRKPEPK